MFARATIRNPSRYPLAARALAASFLLSLLALAGNSTLLARPLGPEYSDGEPGAIFFASDISDPTAEELLQANVPRAASRAARLSASRRASTIPGPTTDLQAAPPAADPVRPAWAVGAREVSLWSGASDGILFGAAPPGSTFRVLASEAGRFRVFYPGDRGSRAPGEAWANAGDLTPVAWPRWVRLRAPGNVLSTPAAGAPTLRTLPAGGHLEVLGEAQGNSARVYSLGDGRAPSAEGWLEAGPAAPIPGPDVVSTFALGREVIAAGGPKPWIKVPYRSQLDGTPYETANCGPTVAGMVLESFGFNVPQPVLRREVLSLQPAENCDDCGVYIQNLAEVIGWRGLKVAGLRDEHPDRFHAWTQDEIRAELRAGRPVIAQVFFRRLPGRATSPYWGDHFVVLTGLLDDRFVFNDPVDVEGPGYARLISAESLSLAMAESDYPFAAFSAGR